ncbi:MAG: pyridoxamine kinase [Oscillospiraceae bacterium]|nr:pyridoxamine kinase [Oscillospiraceae bacterium]
MQNIIPRLAAVHDISGFGKCSLTVVLPILSAMGIEVCPLPTAVLSTHTGGFGDYTFLDMTDDMPKIIDHWKSLDIKFDAIYSGFLGSPRQVDILIDFIEKFKHDKLLTIVDPVMGDHGKLYSTMTDEMVEKMRKLVANASIITPNFTEAALLLGEECVTGAVSDDLVFSWAKRLADLGAAQVVITSVMSDDNEMYVVIYDKQTGAAKKIYCKYTQGVFHGTGDTFTSVLSARLLHGDSLEAAAQTAANFVSAAIAETVKYPGITTRDGILFEKVLANGL